MWAIARWLSEPRLHATVSCTIRCNRLRKPPRQFAIICKEASAPKQHCCLDQRSRASPIPISLTVTGWCTYLPATRMSPGNLDRILLYDETHLVDVDMR